MTYDNKTVANNTAMLMNFVGELMVEKQVVARPIREAWIREFWGFGPSRTFSYHYR